jgi:hypothetical protein
MTRITNDLGTVTGNAPTPSEQADEALLGTPGTITQGETAQESADATLVQLSNSATNPAGIGGELEAGVPADMVAAGALVSDLAAQIGTAGSSALSAQSLIAADAAFKLTKR